MITTFIIGIAGMVGLMVAWFVVQNIWRRHFAGYIDEEDVLAARGGCGNCGCAGVCIRNLDDGNMKEEL